MNGKTIQSIQNVQPSFLEEQLYEAQQAMFASSNVKQIKFLQNKIKYLKQQMKGNKR